MELAQEGNGFNHTCLYLGGTDLTDPQVACSSIIFSLYLLAYVKPFIPVKQFYQVQLFLISVKKHLQLALSCSGAGGKTLFFCKIIDFVMCFPVL